VVEGGPVGVVGQAGGVALQGDEQIGVGGRQPAVGVDVAPEALGPDQPAKGQVDHLRRVGAADEQPRLVGLGPIERDRHLLLRHTLHTTYQRYPSSVWSARPSQRWGSGARVIVSPCSSLPAAAGRTASRQTGSDAPAATTGPTGASRPLSGPGPAQAAAGAGPEAQPSPAHNRPARWSARGPAAARRRPTETASAPRFVTVQTQRTGRPGARGRSPPATSCTVSAGWSARTVSHDTAPVRDPTVTAAATTANQTTARAARRSTVPPNQVTTRATERLLGASPMELVRHGTDARASLEGPTGAILSTPPGDRAAHPDTGPSWRMAPSGRPVPSAPLARFAPGRGRGGRRERGATAAGGALGHDGEPRPYVARRRP